ncbi:MAG: ribbon-helix-helix domain-containing protein [Tardiphaga sp.]|jgi:predicted DNA-binding ribbon-helix-helix protein
MVQSLGKSPVVKRGVVVRGVRTSATLEQAFWDGLKEIAHERGVTVKDLVAEIEAARECPNMSSAIRLFVLAHFRDRPV